jgi:uncharacterized protein YeaO (DUF488 family)
MNLRIKRVYEPRASEDGERHLVDRLWPRGLKKEALVLTDWLKDVAPSEKLRRWFGHDPARWNEFRLRYRAELQSHPELLEPLRKALARGAVTLVYSARDEAHNQAVVLREYLLETVPPTHKAHNRKRRLNER